MAYTESLDKYLLRAGSRNGRWKGGRCYASGYVLIYSKGHPRANLDGYVYEHRLVMEKYLGRVLRNNELVHHINGIRDDNRIENLELFKSQKDHMKHGHRWTKERARFLQLESVRKKKSKV